MKTYFLRRDNKDSGPYSLTEINALGLLPQDLVREECSTEWQHALTIAELQATAGNSNPQITNSGIIDQQLPAKPLAGGYILETSFIQPGLTGTSGTKAGENEGEKFAECLERTSLWPNRLLRERNTLKIGAVFMGLVLGVFCMKWLVDGLIEKTFGTDQKIVLPPKEKAAGKDYQNALVTTIVPAEHHFKTGFLKTVSPSYIKRQVKVTGNGYKVGYFGGISGLKLTVSNGSAHFINQVELQIDYLRQDGGIVETKTYQIRSMHPHSSQILSIPPSTKGARVTYKIMNIYARQLKSLLKEI